MFEQNNIGVRFSNPIVSFIKKMNKDSPELERLIEAVQLVAENMDDEGVFFFFSQHVFSFS